MPIYEYECKKCKRRFEILLKNVKNTPVACPHCGGKKVTKSLSTFSVAAGGAQSDSMPPACASCQSAGCPHRK